MTATTTLQLIYDDANQFEIGVDEAGRGPLFGRLYTAAVVLATTNTHFDEFHAKIKDSKRFSSETKLRQTADWIKQHAVAWSIHYIEPDEIDRINIRQSVLKSMRASIMGVVDQIVVVGAAGRVGADRDHLGAEADIVDTMFVMVDGNDFPIQQPQPQSDHDMHSQLPLLPLNLRTQTFVKGDNRYTCIAAASVLAKLARDDYVRELCVAHPILSTRYQMHAHFGYGTKKHLEAIRTFGITDLHRKSFGPCKSAPEDVTKISTRY